MRKRSFRERNYAVTWRYVLTQLPACAPCWTRRQSGVKERAAAAAAKSCPTLCDPIDGSPPGSPIPGILKARTLEWVVISFSNAWKWKVKVKLLSRVWLLATPWTAAYQVPPSMGFSGQQYWSGVPLPSPSVPLITYNWLTAEAMPYLPLYLQFLAGIRPK